MLIKARTNNKPAIPVKMNSPVRDELEDLDGMIDSRTS
jgi:hypothetical protein